MQESSRMICLYFKYSSHPAMSGNSELFKEPCRETAGFFYLYLGKVLVSRIRMGISRENQLTIHGVSVRLEIYIKSKQMDVISRGPITAISRISSKANSPVTSIPKPTNAGSANRLIAACSNAMIATGRICNAFLFLRICTHSF